MGDLHPAPSWCRLAEFMMFVMEELLITPCLTYIDDSTLVSAEEDIADCAKNFDALSEALGLVRSPKEESNQVPTVSKKIKILGIYFERSEEGFTLSVPAEKVVSLLEASETVIRDTIEKKLSYKCVAKLIGDVNYVLCAGSDRAGAQILRPVFPMLCKELFDKLMKARRVRRNLVMTARKIQALIKRLNPIEISAEPANREWAWMYTDASSGGGTEDKPCVSAVLLTEMGEWYVTKSQDLPEGKRIDFYEAAAVHLGVRSFEDKMRDKRLIVSVDNTVDCHAFIKGSHKDNQTAALISMIILFSLNIAPFFNYAVSELNIADWPTRRDLESRLQLINDVRQCVPVPSTEWRDTGLFLKRIRAEGIDLSHLEVNKELNAKGLLANAGDFTSAGRAALSRSGNLAPANSKDDPTEWALSLRELGAAVDGGA